jgi:sortase A
MYNKITTALVALVVIVATGVFTATAVHALLFAPDEEVAAPALAQKALSQSATPGEHPARLRIPTLGIDANVQYVGITKKSTMAVPSNFTDVAWYKYGPVPGQRGSAVMDGHVDNGLALDGVFKHLSDIKIGDDVYVDTKDGTPLHFVVIDVQLYPYKNVPTQLIFGQSNAVRLNLITCDGAWVKGDKTYDHRLVVYTILAS